MNPYAHHLANRRLDEVLTTTPRLLHEAACALTPEQLEAPFAPAVDGKTKWSPRQILAHLADCELAFSWRLRQVLANPAGAPPPLLQPFDQEAWATRYQPCEVPAALALFRTSREWNLALLTTVTPEDLTRQGLHPERGLLTFQTLLETMAGHDLNHLKQLQSAAAQPVA